MPSIRTPLFHQRITERMLFTVKNADRVRPMAVSIVWIGFTPCDFSPAMVANCLFLLCCVHVSFAFV
jgi:hypothetical protein